jgi:hypothetical protein
VVVFQQFAPTPGRKVEKGAMDMPEENGRRTGDISPRVQRAAQQAARIGRMIPPGVMASPGMRRCSELAGSPVLQRLSRTFSPVMLAHGKAALSLDRVIREYERRSQSDTRQDEQAGPVEASG